MINIFLDLDGRLVYVDINYLNVNYRVINVYAPNDEGDRNIFFDELYPICITQRNIILGGDFNCVLNIQLDKIGGNPLSSLAGSVKIKNIMSDF